MKIKPLFLRAMPEEFYFLAKALLLGPGYCRNRRLSYSL
jgi:hypothetical protein